jgi:hypothetical protein
VAVDVSHGPYVGWEAPDHYGKKQEWAVGGSGWKAWLAGGGLVYTAARLMGGFA